MTAADGRCCGRVTGCSYGGGEHQVVALAGTSVRLRSAAGAESVVLASYLMASPGFEVSGGDRRPGWSRSGCWTGCRRRCWLLPGSWERTSWRR